MRVHHLRCGTMCPIGKRLLAGEGGLFERGELVCHCLLVETDAHGLVLVDAGLGTEDARHPARLGPARFILSSTRDPADTAVARVRALGFSPDEVRHIVVTHLDLDHAGGLSDFPHAKVHLMRDELEAATRPVFRERSRYRAAQWAHGADFEPYDVKGERFYGFEAVRELKGLPPEILLVPVDGHSRGHAAVAVATERRWLLHAGDAYFFRGEMEAEPHCPPGLRAFQRIVAHDDTRRRHNQARLRELALTRTGEVRVFSAHDPIELARATSGPTGDPGSA